MRLLYTTSDGHFRFTRDIIRAEDIPPYAILSHTWGDQEVLYDDVKTSDVKEFEREKQGGWDKIRFCARQAKLDGLEHFWVDTCCIDKANYTELSEAINSMFRWYQKANKCYVYLPNIECRTSQGRQEPSPGWETAFRRSRWFSRGWTLQELLAPRHVEFFSRDGTRLGDKESLKQTIHEVTKIPLEALSGSDMSKFGVEERFSWAKDRQTTREEDEAYCLLGILGCYLPLIYGESKESALKRIRKELQEEERLIKIRNWLSAPDPSINYQKAHNQREPETGLWLLQNENFKRWKEDAASRLWLYGIPGCGKTILSSTVVEHLQHHCRDDKSKATVYFYFDFNDAQKQIPELMLRSLLRQLLHHTITIPESVEALFSSCGNGKQQPSLHSLLDVAPQVMQQFTHVYIVLDALDECTDRGELTKMLERVAGWQLGISHLLMTSRKERDIEVSLETFVVEDDMIGLQRDVVDGDILRFVQQKLRDDRRLAKWNKNPVVRQEIETALMRGAQGMFRWVICQLDMIAECRNRAMLRKSLATLPKTLDQTYDRILIAISEEDRMYTIRILQWLTFSARPLSLREVAEVAAIDVTRDPAFNRDEVLEDPLEVLKICSSLVTIAKEEPTWYSSQSRQIVILAHYSVQEYLISERIRQGPATQYSMKESGCHKAMTIGCLGYLHNFQGLLTDELYDASALAPYSAEFWSDHLQKTGDGEAEMSRLATDVLFTNDPALANWIRIYDPETKELYPHDGEIATPLYYASFLGLTTITKLLLDQNVDVNAQDGTRGSALFSAVRRGHLAVVELLVKAKADVNAEDVDGEFPLREAINNHDRAIARVLIDAGADINKRKMNHYLRRSPIQCASATGDEAIVKLLIEAGADVNMRDAEHCSALQIASNRGDESVVRLLIEAGADVNTPSAKQLGNELWAPLSDNRLELSYLQKKVGAAHDVRRFNALQIASGRGYTAVVQMLLDAGAKVDAEGGAGITALHIAFRCAKETTAMLLLERGANFGSDRQLKGALHVLVDSEWCPSSLVNVLLRYGAPLDTIDIDNMTPLHYCTKHGHEVIAKHLLDAGVHINLRVRRQLRHSRVGSSRDSQANTDFAVSASTAVGLTALHFAALQGKARMTKFLLKHGADPNALSEDGETPLYLALRNFIQGPDCKDDWKKVVAVTKQAREEVVNALLEDPRTSARVGASYLHCIHYGKPQSAILVRRLLSKGADPRLTGQFKKSPLHLAIQAQDHESVKALLSMGANVFTTTWGGINVLHYAAQWRKHDILVALIESEQAKGVKLIRSKDENGRNVLHHMFRARWYDVKTVQWLLDYGANGSELDNFGISPLAQYLKSPRSTLDVKICESLIRAMGTAFVDGPVIKVLHEGGVDMTTKDCRGRTVLHTAVLNNTLTEQLLEYLLNVVCVKADEEDDQGRTALQYATEKADADCDRESSAFRRWERLKTMLSELQETEVPTLLDQQDP